MNTCLRRRTLLGFGSIALTSCRNPEPYFGESTPPATQTLIYELGREPGSLDPAASLGGSEVEVWPALMQPLLSKHPDTLEPQAGLATHYELTTGSNEISFFLRGHP